MELKIENVCKRYRNKRAVDDCNAVLTEGIYALLGPNGSGKTTLMRILATLIRPSSGAVYLDNQQIVLMDDTYRDLIGYLPQSFGYYPHFTGYDFLMYLASLKGIPKMIAEEKTDSLLKLVGLYEVKNTKIKTYSGGMKQRLGIAQSLLGNPKILLLDEPTAGLDPAERIRFRNIIANQAKDKIVLISTHIVSDIEKLADKIMIMKDGKIIHLQTESELLSMIDNSVWTGKIEKQKISDLPNSCAVVNLHCDNNEYHLRVVSDGIPLPGFTKADPNLEDLYLHIFEEERGAR